MSHGAGIRALIETEDTVEVWNNKVGEEGRKA